MSERQKKKNQFEAKQKRSRLPVAVAVALVALAAAGVFAWNVCGAGGPPLVEARGGEVSIPVTEIDDGRAHFFRYRAGDAEVAFFVLKDGEGTLRAALDTCDVCFRERQGYRQEGDFMVCNNCNQKFRSDLINEVKGGCNPVPLERAVKGGRLVLAAAELDRGARYFPAAER